MDKALARGFARQFFREVQDPRNPMPDSAFSSLHQRGRKRRTIRPKDFKALTDILERSMRHPSVIHFQYRQMHEDTNGIVLVKRLIATKSSFRVYKNGASLPIRNGDENSLVHCSDTMIGYLTKFLHVHAMSVVSTGEHAVQRWFMRSRPVDGTLIQVTKDSGADLRYRKEDLRAELNVANCFAHLAVAAVNLYGLEKLVKHRTLDLPLPTPTGVFRSHAMFGVSDPAGRGFRMIIDKNYGTGDGSVLRVKPYEDGGTHLDVLVSMRTFLPKERINRSLRYIWDQLWDWFAKHQELARSFQIYQLETQLDELPVSVRHALRELYDILEPRFSRPSRWGELVQPEVDRLAATLGK